MQRVQADGAWEEWLAFFLDGVAATASEAFDAAVRIVQLFREDLAKIVSQGRGRSSIARIYTLLQAQPILTQRTVSEKLGLSHPAANAALAELEALGILAELTGRRRNRVYAYRAYVDILSEGAQPLGGG